VVNIRDLESSFDPFESGFRSDREMTYPQIKESIMERTSEIEKLKLEVIELENRLKGAGLSTYMQYGTGGKPPHLLHAKYRPNQDSRAWKRSPNRSK